jgi:dienelactone hydrolase
MALEEKSQPAIRFHRKGEIQKGKRLKAIEFAKEITQYLNAAYPEIAVSLYIEKSETTTVAHWFGDYKDLAAYERFIQQIRKDERYLALVTESSDRNLFVREGTHDALLTSIHAFKVEKPVPDLSQGQEGRIFFSSENLGTFRKILAGEGQSTPVTISGTLKIPKQVSGKVSAVIILHGVGGVYEHYFQVAGMLNDMGIAAFVVDSFEPRGIQSGVEILKEVFHSYCVRISDAYAALELLSTHPRIDRDRIAVLGFSHGATVSLLAPSERIRQSFIADDLRFAASIAYYPSCSMQLQDIDTTDTPVLMLLAEKDNMCPVKACLDYAQRSKNVGADVKVIVYEGAYHGFPVLPGNEIIRVPSLPDSSNCKIEELVVLLQNDGTWYYPYRNAILEEVNLYGEDRLECREEGKAIMAGNEEAKAKSMAEYKNLLKKVFHLR